MIAFAAVLSFAACNDSETYKDMRDRELDSISSFLRKENIKVISEDEFTRRWNNNQRLTDTAKNNNEWVLFNSNGIYMQVIDQGCGDYIRKGETADVLVRFDEYNLSYAAEMSDKCLTLSNKVPAYSYYIDKISVTNTSGTFTGSFVDPKASLMANTYNSSNYGSVSSTVPSGWLIPFTWIKIGRPKTDDDRIAHVRLLVPHSYGTTSASGSVQACVYDMTLQKGR